MRHTQGKDQDIVCSMSLVLKRPIGKFLEVCLTHTHKNTPRFLCGNLIQLLETFKTLLESVGID